MLKYFIILSILSVLFFSCQNNDSKIEELEKQMQMQNEATKKDKEAELKKTAAELDAAIINKSDKDEKAIPRMNCKAEYKYLLGKWKGTLRDKSLTILKLY